MVCEQRFWVSGLDPHGNATMISGDLPLLAHLLDMALVEARAQQGHAD